ncbi:hypothetical protein [Sphingomonas quercus]|uniref:Uncharacterized protein n=1 Tax=Sphingomonas quercus TaxID=2842451 RepID=A0ABS6BIK9_9SPHN|nr:hypothetical protein [Sphingomonas quercus]MBU3077667.1 hypothetical protein [Sphingomonas quercus]
MSPAKSVDHWDRLTDGTVRLSITLSWEAATAQKTGLLRLLHAENDREVEAGGIATQVTLTSPQARLMSQDLWKMANYLDFEEPATRQ